MPGERRPVAGLQLMMYQIAPQPLDPELAFYVATCLIKITKLSSIHNTSEYNLGQATRKQTIVHGYIDDCK